MSERSSDGKTGSVYNEAIVRLFGKSFKPSERYIFAGRAQSDRRRVLIRGVDSGQVWDVPPAWAREVMNLPVKKRPEG